MKKAMIVQLKRMVSGRFILVIVLIAALTLMLTFEWMSTQGGVWSGLKYGAGGIQYLTLYILPAIAYSDTAASEWENRASNYWIIRSGIVNYIIPKMVTAMLAGFLCVFIGYALYVLISSVWFPVYLYDGVIWQYETPMKQGRYLVGYLLALTDLGISGAVSAATGMTFSILLKSRFAAVTAPLVILLALIRITEGFLPEWMNPAAWMALSYLSDHEEALLYKAVAAMILISLMMLAAYLGIKRRLEND